MVSGCVARTRTTMAYRDLLLRDHDGGVLATDGDCGMPRARDRLESILCQSDASTQRTLDASEAYAPTWYSRPSGEKTVRYLGQVDLSQNHQPLLECSCTDRKRSWTWRERKERRASVGRVSTRPGSFLVLDHVIWRVLLLLPLSRAKLGACDLAAFLGCS
jgi:hypothetical protein